MPTLFDLVPDASTILSLEPEELAGLGLELVNSVGPHSASRLHPTTFTHPDTIGNYTVGDRQQIEYAMMEAWSWLIQEGLIAPKPGDTSGWHFLTRRGKKIKNRDDLSAYRNAVILPRKLLHPAIEKVCWPSFLRGDYDTAVFQAFKELEVSIREAGKFRAEDYGVELARKAFHEMTGPLTDMKAPTSERSALSHLVAGALGSYKNPHSHRKVSLDANEAIEMIILSSHLLKIIDGRQNGL